MTLETVMFALQAVMSAPETDNAGFVASQYMREQEKFKKIAQHCTHKYARENSSILNVASFDDLVIEVLAMEYFFRWSAAKTKWSNLSRYINFNL